MAKTITLNRRLVERLLRHQFDTEDFLYAHTSILNDARLLHDRAEEAMRYAEQLNARKEQRERQKSAARNHLLETLMEAKDDARFEQQLESLYPR